MLEKTLESPLDSKMKPVSPNSECSLEQLMLKLRLQHIGHEMRRTDSLEKTLMLGTIGYYAKWNKSDRERQILYNFTYV